MILLSFRSFLNLRSGFAGRRSYLRARRRAWRVAPRLLALEVRALLSTITVTNDSDSGSGSLRQALASSVAGETIQFARSAYGTITLSSGPLVVASSVTIDGPGATNLTINGNDAFQDLRVQAAVTARVSGLTITGGEAPTSYPYNVGGGIFNAGTLTVANCVVTKNSAPGYDQGGGIFNAGSLTVTGSVLSDNTADSGGGISSYRGDVNVTNCVISGNSGAFGGGISSYQGDVNVTNCVISGNAGAGVVNTGGVTNLTNCAVTGNTSLASGGGGYGIQCFSDDLNVVNCVVSGNTGGISISGSTYGSSVAKLTVTNSSIVNNTINNSANGNVAAGGGIVSFSADVTVSGSLIANNSVSSFLALGGGVAMETFETDDAANVLTVSDTTFAGNQVIGTGTFGQGFGGAIHTDEFATVSVTNCSFMNNTVTGTGPVQGGAMDLQELLKGTITDSQFTGNQAVVSSSSTSGRSALGGAICNTSGSFGEVLTISGSTFTKNLVQGGPGGGFGLGGAISNQFSGGTLDLSSSVLIDNSAIGGAGAVAGAAGFPSGGFAAGGGLVNNLGAIATVTDSSFIGNTAIGGAASVAGSQGGPGDGGAISDESGALAVSDSSILGNVASGGAATNGALGGNGEGGGIQFIGAPFTLTGVTIIGNSAIGGAGGGDGEGGGVYCSGSAAFSDVLITLNSAIGGSGGGKGVGGGLYIAAGTVTLSPSTKVVGNYATTSNDNIY
jgi:fibronectin-binding autotransporter adhesin